MLNIKQELITAAAAGQNERLRQLANEITPANLSDILGEPLNWASYKGQKSTVELLLMLGASVQYRGADGNTPLHWAFSGSLIETSSAGCTEIIAILLTRGADISVQNNNGMTPSAFAIMMMKLQNQTNGQLETMIANLNARVKILEAQILQTSISAQAPAAITPPDGATAATSSIGLFGSRGSC